jgi:transposase-like protein
MPQEYSWEVRERAKELYVVDGLTFDQVAADTGVSASQLKRWSAEEKQWAENQGNEGKDWPEARKEFRLALGVIRRDSTLLRAKLITNALADGEFKKVLSAAMWEKTQGRGGETPGALKGPLPAAPAPGEAPEPLVIKTPQDAVCALEGLVAQRINRMSTQPELLTFGAIKDLKQTLSLIEDLKFKYEPDEKTGQAPGLSDEAAAEIRRKFLGVS